MISQNQMKQEIKEQIQKFFKGEVDDSEDALLKYSHDASLLEVRPQVVVYPKDTEDVKNLVKWVSENKIKYPEISITARCAGTCMSGGAIGESIIMDFSRYMNNFVGWQGGVKNSITVQPGMFYRDFEKITLEKGLILPCYTASKSINAVGGMFGNNSAGERTLKYGKTENYILESKVVFADGNEYTVKPLNKVELENKIAQNDFEGNVYKNIYELIKNNQEEIQKAKPNVSKNSAGYYVWNVINNKIQNMKNSSGLTLPGVPGGTHTIQNSSYSEFCFDLNKLLVGSQGTLGIVTEITFKVIPDNKYSKLVAIFMNDLSPLGNLVDEILKTNPETVEAYDDKTMNLAVKFFPDFLKNKGFWGIIKMGWSFLPEFFMMLTSGFPKMILLVEFAGINEEEVNKQCLDLKEKIKDFKLKVHITKNKSEAEKYWDIRRDSFALLRNHVKGLHTAPFIDDVVVRPEFLPKFIPELNDILSKYDLVYTIAGHAGDGNFHIIPLMDFSRPDTAKIILELGEKVYDLVLKYKGSITAEHNDGLIRTPYLEKMYGGKMMQIFREIKQTFDDKNIFNPGKKILIEKGIGSKEYITSHILKEHKNSHKV
jgi:FAD/FMN-containing dehydrogenase